MRRAVLLAAVLLTLAGCDASGSSSSSGSGADGPAAALARADGSSDVPTYSAALDAWQAKCRQDRGTDAGYVETAFQDEQKNDGPDSSRLEVMRNLTASVPDDAAPTDCAAATAAYLVLAEPGS